MPVLGKCPKVLILGSLPSQKSLAANAYYAHPRNAFWGIMGRLLDFDPAMDYAGRCDALTRSGIGLWDVLASSVRPGSLDSAIKLTTARANDFVALLEQFASIRLICFNGKKARELFERMAADAVSSASELQLLTLPSTSPANAAVSFDDKLRQWSVIRSYL